MTILPIMRPVLLCAANTTGKPPQGPRKASEEGVTHPVAGSSSYTGVSEPGVSKPSTAEATTLDKQGVWADWVMKSFEGTIIHGGDSEQFIVGSSDKVAKRIMEGLLNGEIAWWHPYHAVNSAFSIWAGNHLTQKEEQRSFYNFFMMRHELAPDKMREIRTIHEELRGLKSPGKLGGEVWTLQRKKQELEQQAQKFFRIPIYSRWRHNKEMARMEKQEQENANQAKRRSELSARLQEVGKKHSYSNFGSEALYRHWKERFGRPYVIQGLGLITGTNLQRPSTPTFLLISNEECAQRLMEIAEKESPEDLPRGIIGILERVCKDSRWLGHSHLSSGRWDQTFMKVKEVHLYDYVTGKKVTRNVSDEDMIGPYYSDRKEEVRKYVIEMIKRRIRI